MLKWGVALFLFTLGIYRLSARTIRVVLV